MRRVMVRYKVKADRANENIELVKAVFEQLHRDAPAGIRYATLRQDDGVSFVHIASVETGDGSNPLAALSAFKAFSAEIRDRCEEPPATFELELIGSYGLFDRNAEK